MLKQTAVKNLNDAEILSIKRLWKKKVHVIDISERIGCPLEQVYNILKIKKTLTNK